MHKEKNLSALPKLITNLGAFILLISVQCIKSDEHLLSPTEDIDIDQFIDLHSSYNRYTTSKRHNLTILAYVTPWNRGGFIKAEVFARKFDIISPVWFQVFGKKKSWAVAGSHQIDKDWLNAVRESNPHVKIAPRFIFEDWHASDFEETFGDPSNTDICVSNILKVIKGRNFDGAVIEIWSQFFGAPERDLIAFLTRLGETFRDNSLISILAIPPPIHHDDIPGRFVKHHFDQLAQYMDYFSLMTYDYSHPTKPGPNSPIEWMGKCVELLVPDGSAAKTAKRSQILTGFNFYGMHYIPEKYAGEPIVGQQFVELVNATRSKFNWDKKAAEHYIRFRDQNGEEHLVYYPTPISIARRLAELYRLGTGMSIWEIGQGLDSFYTQI